MTGLDTNILVRLVLRDDDRQNAKVDALMAKLSRTEPGFVSIVTLVESVWVLSNRYRMHKADVVRFVQGLCNANELVLENHSAVVEALERFEKAKAEFSDCLIERLGFFAGCECTLTFDSDAAKTAGMRAL